jgi:hypothetical protein
MAGAGASRMLAWLAAPALPDDIHRHACEAEVLLRGWSPFAFAPDVPQLASLRADLPPLHASRSHPGTPAASSPLYQAAASAVVAMPRRAGGDDHQDLAHVLAAPRAFAGLCDVPTLWLALALGCGGRASVSCAPRGCCWRPTWS